jgi:cell division protein FtsB
VFPSTTPPTDSGVAGVLAWALGLALVVVGFIFWLREKSNVASLQRERDYGIEQKVEIGKLEVKNEALQKENRELRDARLADAQKQSENNTYIAEKLMRYERRAGASERPGPRGDDEDDADEWRNIPTGVANAMVQRPEPNRALPKPQMPEQSRGRTRQAVVEEPYRAPQNTQRGRER